MKIWEATNNGHCCLLAQCKGTSEQERMNEAIKLYTVKCLMQLKGPWKITQHPAISSACHLWMIFVVQCLQKVEGNAAVNSA